MKNRLSPFALLCRAVLSVVCTVALCAGCGSDSPSSAENDAPPMTMNVVYTPVLHAGSYGPVDDSAIQSLAVHIFEVTGNPFVRTAALFTGDAVPVMADTADLDVPDGEAAFLDTTYDIDVGEESRDYRVHIEAISGLGRRGSRTVTGLAAGETREVDIYLTPSGPPGDGEYGLQLLETWADAGETEHLIPLVLVNADSVGGFQFDLSLESGVIDTVNGIVVDGDSRLYLDANSSSIAVLAESELDTVAAWRVIAFSGVNRSAIESGYSVVLYLSVNIAPNAVTDTLRLNGVVISDPVRDSIEPDSLEIRNAVIHIGEI